MITALAREHAVPYYALLNPAEVTGRLRHELAATHHIEATVHSSEQIALLQAGDLTIWCDGGAWWWWTGRTNQGGRVYTGCTTANVATAARLIAQFCPPSHGEGRPRPGRR